MTKLCKCGKEFNIKWYNYRQQFCSQTCGWKYQKRNPPKERRTCKRCEKMYSPNAANQHYCAPCRVIIKKEQRQEYDRVYQRNKYRKENGPLVFDGKRFKRIGTRIIERRRGDTMSTYRLVTSIYKELKLDRSAVCVDTYRAVCKLLESCGGQVWIDGPLKRRVYKFEHNSNA